jgi:hypothetical protein
LKKGIAKIQNYLGKLRLLFYICDYKCVYDEEVINRGAP